MFIFFYYCMNLTRPSRNQTRGNFLKREATKDQDEGTNEC